MYLDILISRFKKSKSLQENLSIYINNENWKFPQSEMKKKVTKFMHNIAGNIIFNILKQWIKENEKNKA